MGPKGLRGRRIEGLDLVGKGGLGPKVREG